LTTRLWVPGYLKISYDKKQVKDAPSLSTDGELPALAVSGGRRAAERPN
jgi:hypothetical protein